jgi:hypothetical protein
MLRKHFKKSKNQTIFQLKHRVKLFVNVVDDKKTDSTSENICMNIDMSINDDECIILYTCECLHGYLFTLKIIEAFTCL